MPEQNSSKKWIVAVVLAVVLTVGIFAYVSSHKKVVVEVVTPAPVSHTPKHEVVGTSVEGRTIDAYTYGTGTTTLLFVGGIHGGYEWNSVLLAYTFMDYLDKNPGVIPSGLSIAVIPSANPDAVFSVVGKEGRFDAVDVTKDTKVLTASRFNANNVDLNRNFDCKWQPKSTWQSKTVSAGTSAFSEPEAAALRKFIVETQPTATVFWHSQSNAVYASQCSRGILPATLTLMNTYAGASGYPAVKTFDAYATTGAADDWMASIGLAAVTVELKTHESIEWDRNLAGIKAPISSYGSR